MATASSMLSKSKNRKIALIIGNNDYVVGSKLYHCINDANDMKNILLNIGFEVIFGTNVTYNKMNSMIGDFIYQIQPNDIVLLFYAGHGSQWNNKNFLIPVNYKEIIFSNLILRRTICVQDVLREIVSCSPFATIIILDSCRVYIESTRTPSVGFRFSAGLSAMQPVVGSLIAFACDADETTSDSSNTGRNGLFTTHLLKHIGKPNLHIEEIMIRVCADVAAETRNAQRPFRVSSLSEPVYLNSTRLSKKFSIKNKRNGIF